MKRLEDHAKESSLHFTVGKEKTGTEKRRDLRG